LQSTCFAKKKICKRELEWLIGLLLWCSQAWPCLRPFLQPFYAALYRPVYRTHTLSIGQFLEVRALMSSSLRVTEKPALSDVQAGSLLLSVSDVAVKSLADLDQPKLKRGKVSARVAEYGRNVVAVDEGLSRVSVWLSQVIGTPTAPLEWTVPLRESVQPAFADAWASADRAGLGGWFCASEPSSPFDVMWFHVPLCLGSLPESWGVVCLQSAIASLELLAQSALLAARPCTSVPTLVHQRCDNAPSVGAAGKNLSLKPPLVFALQVLAALCFRRRLHVHISHQAGDRNDWADKISRLNEKHSAFRSELDPLKEISVSLPSLLALSALG
jgi:hypothetical protein